MTEGNRLGELAERRWPCGHPRTPDNTQGIGKAGIRCKECRPGTGAGRKMREAAKLIESLVALLTILEWGDEDRPGCPFCGMGKDSGHLDRCQLHDALSQAHTEVLLDEGKAI